MKKGIVSERGRDRSTEGEKSLESERKKRCAEKTDQSEEIIGDLGVHRHGT
jgi:hypothetical protein